MIRNLLGRIKKFVFFAIPKKEVEGVEAETTIFQKLDGFLQSMGLSSTPTTCESNSRIGQKLFLSDAEDAHLLGIDTVEYERSIKTGVKGTSKTINTYDFSADSEQSSL